MTDRFVEVTEHEQPNGYCQRVFKTTRTDCPSVEVVGHEYRFNTDFYIATIGPEQPRQRIVCAAMRHVPTNTIVASARHCDLISNNQINNTMLVMEQNYASRSHAYLVNWEDGFIDQFGTFFNRQQAWKIAEKRDQIIRRVGGDTANGGTLYSENLY